MSIAENGDYPIPRFPDSQILLELRLAAGTALALDVAVTVGRIIVGQLFALADVARGADPDRVADDLRIAVRLAGVVDVARVIAADRRVADVEAIELEAPDVPVLQVARFALQALAVGDLLPRVIDDACVLGNRLRREHAPACDLRPSLLYHSRGRNFTRGASASPKAVGQGCNQVQIGCGDSLNHDPCVWINNKHKDLTLP